MDGLCVWPSGSFHICPRQSTQTGHLSTQMGSASTIDTHLIGRVAPKDFSVGVDQLTNSGQIAPQLFVLLRLPVDLVAGVQHR